MIEPAPTTQFGRGTMLPELDCPAEVRDQVAAFTAETSAVLGARLVGVYLHGSLAFGCFNAARSDVDLLVVNDAPLGVDVKRRIVQSLLRISGSPRPVEVSYLSRADLARWSYPPTYDVHFSEGWRDRLAADLVGDGWRRWNDIAIERRDPDLAAHVTVLRARGICLLGEPIAEVFPPVARADYLAAILDDLAWSREPARLAADPAYSILNHCRVCRYLIDGSVTSKAEAGEWAATTLPGRWRPIVAAALIAYHGAADDARVPLGDAARLVDFLSHEIAAAARI
jgi:predicted nucleotidyltransferase